MRVFPARNKDAIFKDDLDTSSFLKDIIESSSRKIEANSNEILTSFDKDLSQYFSLTSEKSFANTSEESSSADINSSSILQILSISVKSSPFDSSKDSSYIRPSFQEVIASTKG